MADEGWISKYGIPSVIISVAAFAFQQQQQTFDRLQKSIETGYQFYSASRTDLLYGEDVERELSLLRIIGRAFPNIYCDVRADLYQRAFKAEDRTGSNAGADGRVPIDSVDIGNLQSALVPLGDAPDLYVRPTSAPFPTSIMDEWMPPYGNEAIETCPSLAQEGALVAENAPPASAALPTTTTESAAPSTDTPAPAPSAAAPGAEPSAGAGETGRAAASTEDRTRAAPSAPLRAGVRSARQITASAIRGVENVSTAQALTPAPSLMRVFFHVPMGGARDLPEVPMAALSRAELAPYNYRVMRGVERVAPNQFPSQPEIRYYGADQEAAAQQLATYLSQRWREEGLTFRIRPIGEMYPNTPRENIEVWVPDSR